MICDGKKILWNLICEKQGTESNANRRKMAERSKICDGNTYCTFLRFVFPLRLDI